MYQIKIMQRTSEDQPWGDSCFIHDLYVNLGDAILQLAKYKAAELLECNGLPVFTSKRSYITYYPCWWDGAEYTGPQYFKTEITVATEFYCPHCGKDEGVYYDFGMCNSCGEALTT